MGIIVTGNMAPELTILCSLLKSLNTTVSDAYAMTWEWTLEARHNRDQRDFIQQLMRAKAETNSSRTLGRAQGVLWRSGRKDLKSLRSQGHHNDPYNHLTWTLVDSQRPRSLSRSHLGPLNICHCSVAQCSSEFRTLGAGAASISFPCLRDTFTKFPCSVF